MALIINEKINFNLVTVAAYFNFNFQFFNPFFKSCIKKQYDIFKANCLHGKVLATGTNDT